MVTLVRDATTAVVCGLPSLCRNWKTSSSTCQIITAKVFTQYVIKPICIPSSVAEYSYAELFRYGGNILVSPAEELFPPPHHQRTLIGDTSRTPSPPPSPHFFFNRGTSCSNLYSRRTASNYKPGPYHTFKTEDEVLMRAVTRSAADKTKAATAHTQPNEANRPADDPGRHLSPLSSTCSQVCHGH